MSGRLPEVNMTRMIGVALMVTAILMPLSGADFEGPAQGEVVAGPATVSLSQAAGRAGVAAMPPPAPMPDQAHIQKLKHQAPPIASTPSAIIHVPTGFSGGVPVLSQLEGLDQTEFGTPDPAIAAGLSEVMEVINSTWAVFDKSGVKLAAGSLSELFRPVDPPAAVYQPQIFYDSKEQRWVITALALQPSTGGETARSYWLIAASQQASAMGLWYVWKTDANINDSGTSGSIADDQSLGYNDVLVVLTANTYSPTDPADQYAKVRVLDKQQLYEGRLRTFADFWGLKDVDGRPATSVRAMRAPGGAADFYLASVARDSGSHLTIWQVHTTAISPALERLPALRIRYYQAPPDAAQRGTDVRLATGPVRLQSLQYVDGRLYCTFHEFYPWTGDDAAAIRYIVVDNTAGNAPAAGAFAVAVDKTLGNGLINYFNPSVIVDGRGNAYFAFNVSSSNLYPGVGYAGWHEGETLTTPAILKSGLASYGTTDPAPFGRATAIALDPNADNAAWIAGEYGRQIQNWGTALGILSFDPLRYRATVLSDNVPLEVKSDTLLKFGQTRPHWNAVGVRSNNNWQLEMWDANFLTLRARSDSDRPGPQTEFCVCDGNHSPLDTMGIKIKAADSTAAVVEFSQATEGTTLDAEQVNGPYQWNDNDVIRVYEYHATPATDTCFTLSVASGDVNLGMAIFRSPDAPYYVDRSQAVAIADNNGPGQGEYIHFHALTDDYYAIVTWADNKATGQYALSTACHVNIQPNPVASPDAFQLSVGGSGVMSGDATITYDVPRKTALALRVYDAQGRAVRTLVAQDAEPGHYTVDWDGRSATGRTLAAGTYFVRLESKDFTGEQKIVKLQ
jgi:hypothetical protein